MTPERAYSLSAQSVSVCQQLGLTGRVFANNQQAFAMTEGPTDVVRQYYNAVGADSMVETILLHTDRKIQTREFVDYSVWLNLNTPIEFTDTVRHLSVESLPEAMPAKISTRLQIMIEAYLSPELHASI